MTNPDYSGLVERLQTPEFEAARIALCHFWLAIADDKHEGGVRYPELGRKAIETEQALTLYGNAMPEAAAAIKRLTAELAEATATSEGRLKVLNEKANEARREWIRAERAEAALAEAREVVSNLLHASSNIDAYIGAYNRAAAWLERNK